MKNVKWPSIFLVTFMSVLSISAQQNDIKVDNTLAAAIAAGKVNAQFTGAGRSTGDAIRLTVMKTATAGIESLVLNVPSGTLLRSWNASEQDMVIAGVRGRMIDAQRFTPQSQITVSDAAPVTWVLGA